MKILKLLKKGIITTVILVVFILIGYEFERFRSIIKIIVVAIFNEGMAENINNIYIESRVILKKMLYIGIGFILINYLITSYLKNRLCFSSMLIID